MKGGERDRGSKERELFIEKRKDELGVLEVQVKDAKYILPPFGDGMNIANRATCGVILQ
jgi:hypothetical protein